MGGYTVKRRLVLCGVVALVVVPAASALNSPNGQTTLVPSCTACAAGTTVTFTGTGYSDSRTYSEYVSAPSMLGGDKLIPVSSHGGSITFSYTLLETGQYQFGVFQATGHSDLKLAAPWAFIASS